MDLVQRLLYMAVGAASLLFILVRISHSHWKKRGILHETPAFLWGNLKGVGRMRHIAVVLNEIYQKYKGMAPFIGFYAYLKPMVLILDLNLASHILSKDADHFADRGVYHNVPIDPLSENLVQLDGTEWKQLREKIRDIFAPEQMAALLPSLHRVTGNFARSMESHQRVHEIFHIHELVESFNVDVISTLVFGLEGDSLHYANTEFRQMANEFANGFSVVRAYLSFQFPTVARFLQIRSYDPFATEYFCRLIRGKVKERSVSYAQRHEDFLQLLIDTKERIGRRELFGNCQIAAQAFTFIMAGLHASTSTLSFCLYELALRPELQVRARKEIVEVLQRHDDKLNVRALQEMQFVRQVLHETLRKHPPYPFLLRMTVKDFDDPNSCFMLKAGNHAIIPIHAIHNDPKVYPDPQRFDPNRFHPDAVERRHPMSFLPFGYGPRGCIAQHYAELQLMVGLVTFLQHYQFSPCADTPIPLEYNASQLLLAPRCDFPLLVERV